MFIVVSDRLTERTAKGLADAVSGAIRDGALPAGVKLPPIRSVAQQLELSPTTVSAAWALLARSGLVLADGRRGTTVAARTNAKPSRYRQAFAATAGFAIDLSTGVPDPTLLPDLSDAMRRLPGRLAPSSYLDSAVLPDLVEVLRVDWPYRAEAITLTDGSMDAHDLILDCLLRVGDRVAVEQPSFPPLLDLLESRGITILAVGVDDDGPLVADVAEAVRSGARALFCQPRGQNPTGACLTAARRDELTGELRGADVLIIENDSLAAVSSAELITFASTLPAQVVHIRSFAKSHGPDLRLAAVSAPAAHIELLSARRSLGQGWSSRILQRLLLDLLTDSAAVAQVGAARREYARRRAALQNQLAEAGIATPGRDGLNLWVPVADEAAAMIGLAGRGIGVSAGSPFHVAPQTQSHIRITSGLINADQAGIAAAIIEAAGSTRAVAPR